MLNYVLVKDFAYEVILLRLIGYGVFLSEFLRIKFSICNVIVLHSIYKTGVWTRDY